VALLVTKRGVAMSKHEEISGPGGRDFGVVVQFGFVVARSTCPGLPWMTKVPRRGTTSLAVGETHGQGPSIKIAYRPRRGRIPSIPTRRQIEFNPSGVGKSSGRIASVGFTHG
jgi:hypothetical protein